MIIDSQLQFCSAQAISSDGNATNVIDLGLAGYPGDGEPMAVVIDVDVAADHTTGDETYTFNVVCDDNSSLSSPTTLATASPPATQLTAGSRIIVRIPELAAVERYLGVAFDVGGTTPSITVSTFLAPVSLVQAATAKIYKDNSTIS